MAKELAAKTIPAKKTEALAKKDERAEEAEVSGPKLGAWLGRLARAVILLVLVILLGAAIGLAVYVLVPLGIQAFLQPVEENSARIAELEAELAEQAVVVQAQEELLTEHEERLGEVVVTLDGQDAALADQAEALEAFEVALGNFDATLGDQEEMLTGFDERVGMLEEDLPGSADIAALNRNVALLTAWQEVLKARLRLVQNNPGLALDELALAQSTLQALYASSSEEQQAELDPILERLDWVVENITENPFAATEDLEVAWHDLDRLITASLSGVPEIEVLEGETLEGAQPEGRAPESELPEE
jgi:hypothetical protein